MAKKSEDPKKRKQKQAMNELAGANKQLQDTLGKRWSLENELLIKDYAIGSAAVGIGITDLKGNLTYANQALLQMGGYESAEVMGKHARTFFEDEKEAEAALKVGVEKGSWRGEIKIHKKDGSAYYVMVWANLVTDKAGKPVCLMASVADITERRQMEEQLARQASVLNTVMENTGTMLVYLDRDFNFVMANKAYVDACGHTWKELKGKNHFSFFPDEENETTFRKVRDTGEAISFHDKPFEYADQPWRGVTYWDWTLVPVKDSSGEVTGLVFSLIETTERKRTEVELAHLASFPELDPNPHLEMDIAGNLKYLNPAAKTFFPDLPAKGKGHPFLEGWKAVVDKLQGEKLSRLTREVEIGDSWYEQTITSVPPGETYRLYARDITEQKKVAMMKDEFIGMVSHELRTPLTVVMSAVKTAMDERVSHEECRELLREANSSAEALGGILDNLLELSRYQAGRLKLDRKPASIREIAGEALKRAG